MSVNQKWITAKLVSEPRSWLRSIDICGKKLFFGSRPKVFKHIPQASQPDKRHCRFFYPFAFCFSVSLVIALTKRGPSSPSWKHLSDADSSFSFSVIPLCIFSPHWLASCACCVTYAPLPLGSTPPLRSQGTKGLLLLFEEAGRKVSSHTLKRRKASAFGERGGAPPGQWGGSLIFFFFFLKFPMRRSDGESWH